MSTCLNEDTLLRIGDALNWKIEEPLRHLHDCAECTAMLADLRELDQTFGRYESTDPAMLAGILRAIENEEREERATAVRALPADADRGIRFLGAVIITFVVLITAAPLQTDQPVSFPAAFILALVTGLIVGALNRGTRTGRLRDSVVP